MGGKPEVMKDLDIYHFVETHEDRYGGADKPRITISSNLAT